MLFYQKVSDGKRAIHLAMGQMRVDGADPGANLDRATRVIADAAARGADIVLLPEALDVGWAHPCAVEMAEPIPAGRSFGRLAEEAALHRIWVCAGLVERDGGTIYNAAVLIDPSGRLVLKHRKINELYFAREFYATGEGTNVAETEFGRVGIMICADAFIEGHTVSRSLGEQGAKVILSPCAWAVPAGHDNEADPYGELWIDSYAPVAREFSLWIAGVSNVGMMSGGEWTGRTCIGSSMLVNPAGEVAHRCPYGAEAEVTDLVEIGWARGD